MGNVLLDVSLFLLVIHPEDIIMRIVDIRPRYSVADDTITYFAQARIAFLDNSFCFAGSENFDCLMPAIIPRGIICITTW